IEAARGMAERVLTKSTAPERIEFAFRLVLARAPTADEVRVLEPSVARLRADFARNVQEAQKLLRTGESRRNEGLDPVEYAAYTVLCHTIMNLDEALTRE